MSPLKPKPAVTEKTYWRSLDRLLDSPPVREALSDPEFPDGADLPPDAVSRRTMLSLMGASFAMAGLAGCRRPVETIVPYVDPPEHVVPGVPRYYATTMPLGTHAYGVVVESHEGRPTKIEGNELHPSSRGSATAWMQAAPLQLFDPDRSRGVLARGEDGAYGESSWEQFASFWQTLYPELEASGGEGLAVLIGSYSSPTLARLEKAFRERYPAARWASYEPLGEANVFRGCELAAGRACRPVYRLEKARKILALDADFLHAEGDSLAAARGFADGRRVKGPEDGMNRLYAVESSPTITGAMADHRLRLQSRQIAAFAGAVASALGVASDGPGAEALPAPARARAAVIADDLAASPGEALVVAGRAQPPEVHALTVAINRALGALGETVSLRPLRDVGYGRPGELAELAKAMRDGAVETLFILGGNPVYDAPADLDFAGALETVTNAVHLSSTYDETSRRAGWHLPETHFLEAWGDARAADGTASVIQPLIAPLHDGRSAVELLDQIVGGEARSGYDVVRETWQTVVGEDLFEQKWRLTLHDGVYSVGQEPDLEPPVLAAATPAEPDGETPAGEPVPAAQEPATQEPATQEPAPAPTSNDGLEITFRPSLAAYDGRFANNGWLQELPDAMTKLTWDNAALVSPATAEEFGIATGDVVSLGYRDRALDVPVFILPGQADGSIALPLGYGRTAAGRVADGVGVNAYLLRDSAAPDFDGGLTMTKIRGDFAFAQTQEHWSMEGRPLIREASLDQYRENPDFVGKKPDPAKSYQLFDDFDYTEGPQWGMAIDLNSCIGCNACIVACQSENNVPVVGKEQVSRGREMHWLRVDRYFSGSPEDPEVAFQPIPCMHCENAPCEQVCPVAATVHDREGLNAMVYNRCIGTRYCSNNCPYKVRRFNFFNFTKDTPELMKMAMNPDVTVRSRGVMEKCSYCLQRISAAKIEAKKQGRGVQEGDVKTACQQTCPTDAITFGNLSDPASEVVRWKEMDRDYVLLGELNNRPRTSYLARLRNPNPAWERS